MNDAPACHGESDVIAPPVGDAPQRAPVVFAGTLPPPVTGMTAMTAVVVGALQKRAPITVFNWSPGKPLKGWRWRLARGRAVLSTLLRLLRRGRAPGDVLYFAVSSGFGLYYDLAMAALARALGYRLVAHHHAYSYIDRRNWRAALLNRLVGAGGAHVVHCRLMRDHLLAQYRTRARFVFVPPTIVSQQLAASERSKHDGFTLGFLSNITLEKGLPEAIATFAQLASAGRDVRLVLAGPCMGGAERRMIDELMAAWPDRVDYRGPIYGPDKGRFYADVDAFLFPTKYRNESWGIVLTEALSVGCPVIARSRGCVPWIVRDDCGLVVHAHEDFVTLAAQRIKHWMESPGAYESARRAALRRWRELEQDAQRELPAMVDQVLAMTRQGAC